MHTKKWKIAVQISLIISCFNSADALSGSTSQHRLLSGATVSVYSSSTSGVLDPIWDPLGPSNLEGQLKQLNLDVVRVDGHHAVPVKSTTAAFVIPAASGDSLYADVEDVSYLAGYVSSGGLVIVHDSMKHSEGTRDLIAQILELQGDWQHCEAVTAADRSYIGSARLSSYAKDFLSGPWPQRLEDTRHVQAHSWCKHSDPAAVSYPLYTLGGDPMKAVAQAFGKVGSPGAVVWLGYSWKDGPKHSWGSLLGQLIQGFAKGMYQAPTDASIMDRYPLRLDALVDSVAALADDTAEAVRRFLSVLAAPAYGPGYSGAPGYHLPTYPVPSYPPPTYPPPSPKGNDGEPRFKLFDQERAHGVQGTSRPVVWYDDADFSSQLSTSSKLWLINRDEDQGSCKLDRPCRKCDQAWSASQIGDENGFPTDAVVLFFREPVLLKTISITELSAHGVSEVFLLKWPAVPIKELGVNTTKLYDSVNPAFDVFKSWDLDSTACGASLTLTIPRNRSGLRWRTSANFNQTHLPPFLKKRAVGGVGIRLRVPPNKRKGVRPTQIAGVRFSGRVLYPRNSELDIL